MNFIIILLTGFLIGYAVGRRTGRKEGIELGLSYAPLEIRGQSLQNNKCSICGTDFHCDNFPPMLE